MSLVLASSAPSLGEPRWLLFPAVLFALLRPLVAAGLVHGVEAALQPFLWVCVASGFVFLWSLRAWLRAECADAPRRAALVIAAVTALPVLRNQQYAYVKFFVLWPVLVGVLAVRFRARHVLAAALLVLAMNGWVLGSDVARGRRLYASSTAAYRRASPTSCWMTSGWAPPFHYLWPGTSTGMIATLATGSDPATQARVLTDSLRDCFCHASEVWTDTGSDSAPIVRLLETHFHYDAVDLTKLLFDPSKGSRVGTTSPPIYVYSDRVRSDTCRSLTPPTAK